MKLDTTRLQKKQSKINVSKTLFKSISAEPNTTVNHIIMTLVSTKIY